MFVYGGGRLTYWLSSSFQSSIQSVRTVGSQIHSDFPIGQCDDSVSSRKGKFLGRWIRPPKYDISDFKVIQPEYGTMEDFQVLIDRCKELDIKLLLDFVPNHCSSEHEWFKKAIDPHDSDHRKYKDFFIWHKGILLENGTRVPPSNWLSVFRGSAWEWVDTMQAYYLHQFLEVQPDLNYRNPNVVKEMTDVIRFWLRKGVSGFRVDAVPFIFEAEPDANGNYVDEEPSGKCLDDPMAHCYLNNTQTEDLDETYDVIYQWRKILEEKEFAGQTKILMSEGYTTLSNVMRYYGEIDNGAVVEGKYGVQVPFNFLLQSTQLDTKASEYKTLIDEWMSSMPKGNKIQANWVASGSDNCFGMWKISMSFCVSMLCASSAAVLAEDEWWENGHFYHIYTRSFQDSDKDGIGDLNGITSRLSYLKFIGVTGVWLSPIFKSPMVDFGYDISDFKVIQPEYGTMEDFQVLIDRCKELDIKLLLDFVPNHCSSEHEWFKKAIDPHDSDHRKYKDFFIWHKGKLLENGTRVPPSNWLSVFRGSAWEWVDTMQAYYLHQFLEVQPDLNYRNPNVVEEMTDVIRFWLRKGISGFRVDAVPYIFEAEPDTDGNYVDEALSGKCLDDPLAHCYLNKTQTKDLDETYDVIYQWRKILDEKEFAGHTKILMSEGYTTLPNVMRYYGQIENGAVVEGKYGAQVPFNFLLQKSTQLDTKASEYKSIIEEWMSSMPKGNKIQANWVLGNHDNKRIASKFRPSRIDLFNILLKTLPGVTFTYYVTQNFFNY
ncbi:hypothetical protein HA402_011888 [Bradysia odoriphaga]|nr:hypothetical protein HA402_011888 [Bradysia odoriphaga]